MLQWVAKLYARRIVNVNVNIIVAGVLSLPVVLGVLKIGMLLGLNDAHALVLPLVTFVADVTADVTIYYLLHWLANHSPWRKQMLEDVALAAARMNFFKDATIVQFERAVLSPLLYVIWFGTQWLIINLSDNPKEPTTVYLATIVGFVLAISVTRTLHTVWMLTKERRQALAAAKVRLAGTVYSEGTLPPLDTVPHQNGAAVPATPASVSPTDSRPHSPSPVP